MKMGKILRYSLLYGMMFGALGGYKIANHQLRNQRLPQPNIPAVSSEKNLSPELQVRKDQIKREIENIRFYTWHERDLNQGRIKIARLNIELANFDSANYHHYLEEANIALNCIGPDEHFRFHLSGEYIRDYLDAKLQLATTHFANQNHAQAIATYKQILRELESKDVLRAQQIHEYSVPGYRNRANLELALVYFSRGKLDESRRLLKGVRGWAREETGESPLSLWWREENPKDIRYLEAKATLNLARIADARKEYAEAFGYLRDVLLIEETGQADGFMNIGFEAWLYTMWVCLESSESLDQATARFQEVLPLEKINEYEDFSRTLGYPHGLPPDNPWDASLQGLRTVELDQKQRSLLRQVIITTDIHR